MVLLCMSEVLAKRIYPPRVVRIYLFGCSIWEPDVSIRIVPVLLNRTHHLVVEPGRFIERGNDRNDRGIARELGSEGLDDFISASDGPTLGMPSWEINPVARVVETVLASGSAVEVHDDLQPVFAGPGYGLVEVWKLALDIRFA